MPGCFIFCEINVGRGARGAVLMSPWHTIMDFNNYICEYIQFFKYKCCQGTRLTIMSDMPVKMTNLINSLVFSLSHSYSSKQLLLGVW